MSNKLNPANEVETSMTTRTRVPMSLPMLKLEVPEIPRYHLHWMRGDAQRIAQAQRAGYEFVDNDEIDVNNSGLADDASASGNQDMGTRVSLVSGGASTHDGQPGRLYLMKIKEEFWQEDQKVIEDRNEELAQVMRGGDVPGVQGDGLSYVPKAHKQSVATMFTRKNK